MEEYFLSVYREFEPKGKRKICIQGMPGIALAGKYAVDYLIKESEAKKIFDLYFNDLPPQVSVDKGLMQMPSVYLNYSYNSHSGDDLLFLSSDFQPLSHDGVNSLSSILAEELRKLGVNLIISLGASAVNNVVKDPKIYVSATSSKLLNGTFTSIDFDLFTDGVITGMNGVLPAIVNQSSGIEGVILLVEACRYLPYDYRAARRILQVIEKSFNLKVDYEEIDGKIRDFDQSLEKLKLGRERQKTSGKDEKTNYIG